MPSPAHSRIASCLVQLTTQQNAERRIQSLPHTSTRTPPSIVQSRVRLTISDVEGRLDRYALDWILQYHEGIVCPGFGRLDMKTDSS